MVTQGTNRAITMTTKHTLTEHDRQRQLFRLQSFIGELQREQPNQELRSWYEQYKKTPFDTPLR